jgi:hypothetical protein
MAKGKFMSDSAYNQTGKEDSPEQANPYHSWDEVLSNHGKTEDFESTVNSKSGEGIMGHGAPGDPHAGGHGKK